jgi:hypothetical protein
VRTGVENVGDPALDGDDGMYIICMYNIGLSENRLPPENMKRSDMVVVKCGNMFGMQKQK